MLIIEIENGKIMKTC